MKIIDLLNKIANGEEVPKKIKYDNIIFEYDGIYYMAEYTYLDKYCDLSRVLNDTLEILEEKKIPEKITINDNGTLGFPNGEWTGRNMDKAFAMKINSIIDYLNSKGE